MMMNEPDAVIDGAPVWFKMASDLPGVGYHVHELFFPTADDDDLIQCMGCDVEWQQLQAWHESVSDEALLDEVERRKLFTDTGTGAWDAGAVEWFVTRYALTSEYEAAVKARKWQRL